MPSPWALVHAVELLQERQAGPVTGRGSQLEGLGREKVGDWLFRVLDVYGGGLVPGGQETGSPVDDAARGKTADVRKDDKGREVV